MTRNEIRKYIIEAEKQTLDIAIKFRLNRIFNIVNSNAKYKYQIKKFINSCGGPDLYFNGKEHIKFIYENII